MTSVHSSFIPFDSGLPGAHVLCDCDQMLEHVQSSYVRDTIDRLRIRYLEYAPGESVRVQYRAEIGNERWDLVAGIGCARPSADVLARLRESRVVRATFGTHGPVSPVSRIAAFDAIVTWYPIDIGLPILACSARQFEDIIGYDLTGRSTRGAVDDENADTTSAGERMAWVPGRRAALRFPNAIVKCYSSAHDARIAERALRYIDHAHFPTARLITANVANGLVAQQRLSGETLTHADALPSAALAMQLLMQLHAISDDAIARVDVPVNDARTLLQTVVAPTSLVQFCRPDLRNRIASVLTRLQRNAPTDLPMVISHGDYNIGQLLRNFHNGAISVLDFDTLCIAPRAFDVASYAVNVMSGRANDINELAEILLGLRGAYGANLADLDWYVAAMIMRRLDRPLRRLKSDCDARTEVMLAAAEHYATL